LSLRGRLESGGARWPASVRGVRGGEEWLLMALAGFAVER
jgi:hypothetical protein